MLRRYAATSSSLLSMAYLPRQLVSERWCLTTADPELIKKFLVYIQPKLGGICAVGALKRKTTTILFENFAFLFYSFYSKSHSF